MSIKLKTVVFSHFTTLNNRFLPIQQAKNLNSSNSSALLFDDSPQSESRKIINRKRLHFAVPLLCIIFYTAYGTFCIPYQEAVKSQSNWFPFSWKVFLKSLPSNKYFFTHQISPHVIWQHFDIAATFSISFAIGIYLNAMGLFQQKKEENDKTQAKYQVWQAQKGEQQFIIGTDFKLEKEVSKKIAFYQRVIPFLLWSFLFTFLFVAMIFYYVNLVLNDSYSVSAFSIAYWVFLLPIFIYYTFYALMGALQYIMLSSRILRIRQQHWLEEFEKQRFEKTTKKCFFKN